MGKAGRAEAPGKALLGGNGHFPNLDEGSVGGSTDKGDNFGNGVIGQVAVSNPDVASEPNGTWGLLSISTEKPRQVKLAGFIVKQHTDNG